MALAKKRSIVTTGGTLAEINALQILACERASFSVYLEVGDITGNGAYLVPSSLQFYSSGGAATAVGVTGISRSGAPLVIGATDVNFTAGLLQSGTEPSSHALDNGFFGQYHVSGTTKYAGFFFDATDDKFRAFRDLQAAPSGVVNTAGTGYTVATIVANLEGNVTGNATGSAGSCTGNAATATALQTPRTINGTSFDGTANITVAAAAGTLTGTTLAATVVTSSLTTVGTIGTGTWQGSIVAGQYGGSGVANTGTTFTRAGNVEFAGAFAAILRVTAATDVTLPTTGTLATTAQVQAAANHLEFVWRANGTSLAPGSANITGGSSIAEQYPVLQFDAATAEYTYYCFRMPRVYNGNGLTFTIWWSNTAGSGDCVWTLAIRDPLLTASAVTGSGTYTQVSSTETSAAANVVKKSTLSFTGAAITALGLVAGDIFVVRLRRFANAGADTLAVDASVWDVTGCET